MTKSLFDQLNTTISKELKHYAKLIFAQFLSESIQEQALLTRRQRNNLLLDGQYGSWLRDSNSYGYWRRPELQSAVLLEILNSKLATFNRIAVTHFGQPTAKKLFLQFQQYVNLYGQLSISWSFQYDPQLGRFLRYAYPGKPVPQGTRADRLLKITQEASHPHRSLAIERFQYLPYGMSRRAIQTERKQQVMSDLLQQVAHDMIETIGKPNDDQLFQQADAIASGYRTAEELAFAR